MRFRFDKRDVLFIWMGCRHFFFPRARPPFSSFAAYTADQIWDSTAREALLLQRPLFRRFPPLKVNILYTLDFITKTMAKKSIMLYIWKMFSSIFGSHIQYTYLINLNRHLNSLLFHYPWRGELLLFYQKRTKYRLLNRPDSKRKVK